MVRQAARRFLAKQIALGTLEHTAWDSVDASVVDTPEHRALALEAATQSIVLLRNEHISTGGASVRALPLKRASKLAFIGPHADSTVEMLGNYHGVNIQVLNRTVKDTARQQNLDFKYSDGTDVAAAVTIAKGADTAVLFLGLTEINEGEGHDRKSLELPPAQMALATAVVAAQPHTILVLINGGALAVEALITGNHPIPGMACSVPCTFPLMLLCFL